MDFHSFSLFVFAIITMTTVVSARAVNISNTWMLPEEGFPVFYRYFRDRISWYEADAVCQFHHANLVTADSSSEYDAIRAYLKELDIAENVWIGLSKTTGRPNFTWTDFRPLSGDGYWQQSIPNGDDPLCVAMDPAADFLWKPMTCGGPEVASFICELPVPSWAIGPRGCLLTELPSLTVLYIPEQLALELTSDCGLDGTKRIACKGNADREEILKQLTCAISPDDFEDKSTKLPTLSNTASSFASESSSEDNSFNTKTTKPWIWTSNTIDIDYGMPTRHRRETEDTLGPMSTRSTTDLSVHESFNKNKVTSTMSNTNYETDTTTMSPEKIFPVESNTSKNDKFVGRVLTKEFNTQSEEVSTVVVSVETKGAETGVEDTGEYPSAIGQGQLFSIIENGTMFDIIELNETTSDDLKLSKDIMMETPQSEHEVLKLSTVRSSNERNDNLYTTVVYQKEPPSEILVTNRSVKMGKYGKKEVVITKDKITQGRDHFQNNVGNTRDDKTLSKEVEMFPIMTDSLVKLNRTHRKELPLNEEDNGKLNEESTLAIPAPLNFSNTNELNNHEPQHIQPKWQEKGNLFIKTKSLDLKKVKGNGLQKQNLELEEDDDKSFHKIDSKIDLLNTNFTENNESEVFVLPKPEKMKTNLEEPVVMKKNFLPKSLLGKSDEVVDTTSEVPSSSTPLEPEPQAQPRPNRQRQLTRPQRRSFYPYFFSRVLG